jgi:hypothetical protein
LNENYEIGLTPFQMLNFMYLLLKKQGKIYNGALKIYYLGDMVEKKD